MSKLLRLLLIAVALLSVGLTACGGDDDDDGAASGSASVDADAGADEDVDVDFGELGDDCLGAATAFAEIGASAGAAFTGEAGDMEDALDAFEDFADAAPEAIEADVRLMFEAYSDFIRIVVESGFDPQGDEQPDADAMAALSEAAEELDTEELQAASERVEAYFEAECGDLGE